MRSSWGNGNGGSCSGSNRAASVASWPACRLPPMTAALYTTSTTGAAGSGVDADQRLQPGVEPGLLFELADGGILYGLAAVDEPGREGPPADLRVHFAPYEDQLAVYEGQHNGGNLRVEEDGLAAAIAMPVRLSVDRPVDQAAAAGLAEPDALVHGERVQPSVGMRHASSFDRWLGAWL